MRRIDAPTELLQRCKGKAPGIFNPLDTRSVSTEAHRSSWPYCFDFSASRNEAELAAFYAWGHDRVAYSFSHILSNMLVKQAESVESTFDLPTEVFKRLPYPCAYINVSIVEGFSGFIYYWRYIPESETTKLILQFVHDDQSLSREVSIDFVVGGTVYDCIRETKKSLGNDLKSGCHDRDFLESVFGALDDKDYIDAMAAVIVIALQFILYLASDNANITYLPPLLLSDSDSREVKLEYVGGDIDGMVLNNDLDDESFNLDVQHIEAEVGLLGSGTWACRRIDLADGNPELVLELISTKA